MEIIAEIGQNHNGDMGLAVEMIHAAKENGADVVKFQLYNARKLFPVDNNPWYEYNCKTELSRGQVGMLAEESRKAGIEFMASVFDLSRVEWLEELGVRRHKVASRSIYDNQLIERLILTGKPLLVSLGMWNKDGFPEIRTSANVDFLYCVSKYPTLLEDVKLGRVDFTKYSGFSDHTIGIAASVAALARGARIIEKHFTLDKTMYGPDHICSIMPGELLAIDSFRKDIMRLL